LKVKITVACTKIGSLRWGRPRWRWWRHPCQFIRRGAGRRETLRYPQGYPDYCNAL